LECEHWAEKVWCLAYCGEELEGEKQCYRCKQERMRFCFEAHSPIRVWEREIQVRGVVFNSVDSCLLSCVDMNQIVCIFLLNCDVIVKILGICPEIAWRACMCCQVAHQYPLCFWVRSWTAWRWGWTAGQYMVLGHCFIVFLGKLRYIESQGNSVLVWLRNSLFSLALWCL